MSDLTNRLLDEGLILSKRSFRDQCGGPDCALSANLAYEAADRIDKLEECLRDFLAEHDNAAIEQPDAKTLILYWARNNDMVTKARAMLEEK